MAKLPLDEFLVEAFKRNKCKQVHPLLYPIAVELITRCWKEDVFIVFTDGLRTDVDQAILYGKGRKSYVYKGKEYGNPKASKVSNALPGSSFHNYGLALDFVTCDGFGKGIDWVVGPKWRRAAAIAKELGFTWGGDWKSFRDNPHIEYNGGLSISQVRSGLLPKFKPFTKTQLEEELTVSQAKELQKQIDALTKQVKAMQKELDKKPNAEVSLPVTEWAREPYEWAKKLGITDGTNPRGTITRQQALAMLHRYHEEVNKK